MICPKSPHRPKSTVGEAWESWATFYILPPYAFPICHIILFPVVLRSTEHAKQSELDFILHALCRIGKKCDPTLRRRGGGLGHVRGDLGHAWESWVT